MRFRVACIQDAGLSEGLTDARLWLEGWLNRTLGDADFGCPEVCIMLVVFASSCLPRAPAVSRFVSNGEGGPTLALHVTLDPERLTDVRPSTYLALLSGAIVRSLPVKPLHKPKGLDYARLRTALVACIEPHAACAV